MGKVSPLKDFKDFDYIDKEAIRIVLQWNKTRVQGAIGFLESAKVTYKYLPRQFEELLDEFHRIEKEKKWE